MSLVVNAVVGIAVGIAIAFPATAAASVGDDPPPAPAPPGQTAPPPPPSQPEDPGPDPGPVVEIVVTPTPRTSVTLVVPQPPPPASKKPSAKTAKPSYAPPVPQRTTAPPEPVYVPAPETAPAYEPHTTAASPEPRRKASPKKKPVLRRQKKVARAAPKIVFRRTHPPVEQLAGGMPTLLRSSAALPRRALASITPTSASKEEGGMGSALVIPLIALALLGSVLVLRVAGPAPSLAACWRFYFAPIIRGRENVSLLGLCLLAFIVLAWMIAGAGG